MPRPTAPYVTSLPVHADGPPPSGPRTVVCFGLPRGGTSMVAGALLGLGVPMGDRLENNIEDPKFNILTHQGSRADFTRAARATIALRDARHPVWGWKCPFTSRYLTEIIGDLRAPHLVYVYRDPVPMALRARVEHEERFEFLAERLHWHSRNTALIADLGCPSLLVSYEAASRNPAVFLEELAAFLGLAMPADLDAITAFLTPGRYKDPSDLMERIITQGPAQLSEAGAALG